MSRPAPLVLLVILALVAVASPGADGITGRTGTVGLSLMLRKLATTGTVMHVTAHPDDEHNGLMAMQSHGQGLRVVLATATRGNGGQNEIGPEIFEALGVLRTEELLAAHQFDGAEQFFGRAVDFGYSFSIEETFEKWGREEILADYVRLIRLTRPDVLITMRPGTGGGGQHHQASAVLGAEAFRAAPDTTRFPGMDGQGLRPWQPLKVYQMAYFGMFRGEPEPDPSMLLLPVNVDVYDPLLGRTYAEIGSEARAMHKCQGFGQLLALPGSFEVRYRLADTVLESQRGRQEQTLFEGIDTSIRALARFAGPKPPAVLTRGLGEIDASIRAADQRLRAEGPHAAGAPLAKGLTAARTLRDALHTLGLDETAVFEIDFRLTQTIGEFEQALRLAHGLRFEALADDGVVTPGQKVTVTAIVANRGAGDIEIRAIDVEGFEGRPSQCRPGGLVAGGIFRCEDGFAVPADARVSEPYWTREGEAGRYEVDPDAPFGLPFRPTPFALRLTLRLSGVDVPVRLPVERRYEGNIFSGEKRMELHVVPALSVKVSPEIAIVPANLRLTASGGAPAREIRVTVTSGAPGVSEAAVSLDLPEGWRAEPANAALRFARADEADTVRFRVTPPAGAKPGRYVVRAKAVAGGRAFDRGYDVIEYPHTRRRHIYAPASTTLKVIDVRVPEGLRVGYVMGVGDQVPPAIEQLGARVVMLDAEALASGDFEGLDAIVTGVRAYERREDLRAYNQRLIEYARRGGTVIVQYNKYEFNQAQYGPFAAKVSSDRVTDEAAPVRILDPEHPVFRAPNRITGETWQGWVQERGLYFLGERAPEYVDLVELEDPFANNPGPKRGALVEARVGDGRWIYVGLGLWRQLPAGTEGAYRLLANLISLGREGASGGPVSARP